MNRLERPVLKAGLALLVLSLLAFGQDVAPLEGQQAKQVVASADGVPIVYETRGQGAPALVLVHGWSCDRSYWEAQVRPLSERFRVVTVDLAGHGESGLGREEWTMATFGADVAAVVRELDLQQVVLVGHSMGGDVIVEAARQLPNRVAGLVWVDTYKELGDPRTPEEVRDLMAPFRADFGETTRTFVRDVLFRSDADPALVEQVAMDMSSAPPEVALGALESAVTIEPKILAGLQELDVPVVAINPEEPPTDVESMERYGVEVVLMSGVSHFLMMEDPTGFNRLLTEVVDGFVRTG